MIIGSSDGESGDLMQKVLIAMSGGVDSSVAAYILKEQNYNCVGAMMKLYADESDTMPPATNKGCCSLEDAEDARAVATALGIPFFVFNFTGSFEEQVMNRFIHAYQNGRTPNPCIDCNRYMKFEKLLQRATELEATYIATGHYAQVAQDQSGRHLLKRSADPSKDQTYVLYAMTQTQLARTLFPLGGLTKDQVRAIAANLNFSTADKRDSQDICFAPDGDYAGFIERHTGQASPKGDFISPDGRVLGRHNGLIHYTIGQRKGLGLYGPAPQYVSALDPNANTVTVGPPEDLFTKSLTARDINLIPMDSLDGTLNVQAKIRYSQPAQPAKLWQTGPDELHVQFEKPQRAITPGQAVVLYDGDLVIGGGTICF